MSINTKVKYLKRHRKVNHHTFKILVVIVLCFICFIFTVSYIRYQQCLRKNQQLKLMYESLLVKIKELEQSKNTIEGVNRAK